MSLTVVCLFNYVSSVFRVSLRAATQGSEVSSTSDDQTSNLDAAVPTTPKLTGKRTAEARSPQDNGAPLAGRFQFVDDVWNALMYPFISDSLMHCCRHWQ